jgi:hypothetical protein
VDDNTYNYNITLEEKMNKITTEMEKELIFIYCLYHFRRAFEWNGLKDRFSYNGLSELFLHLNESDVVELDAVAFACKYTEYDSIEEFNADHNTDYDDYEDIDETIVIPINNQRFIIQEF